MRKRHFRLATATFGRDHDSTVNTIRSKERGSLTTFQDGNAFNIVGVQVADGVRRNRHTIQYNQARLLPRIERLPRSVIRGERQQKHWCSGMVRPATFNRQRLTDVGGLADRHCSPLIEVVAKPTSFGRRLTLRAVVTTTSFISPSLAVRVTDWRNRPERGHGNRLKPVAEMVNWAPGDLNREQTGCISGRCFWYPLQLRLQREHSPLSSFTRPVTVCLLLNANAEKSIRLRNSDANFSHVNVEFKN